MENLLLWKHYAQFRQVEINGRLEPIGPCNGTSAVIIAGHGVTDANGRWDMLLPNTVCPAPPMPIDGPASFVATPTADGKPQPVILSAAINGTRIIVQTWTLGGAAAPDVNFSWHCVVESHGP